MQLWQPTRGILQPNQHWRRGQEVAAAGTTWNPSDKAAGITLSGSNLTATCSTAGIPQVRSVASRAYGSGKFYCEFLIGAHAAGATSSEDMGIGIASLGSHSFSNYLGQGGTATGAWARVNNIQAYFNGGTTALGSGAVGALAGQVWAMAADLTGVGPTLWWRNVTIGTGWNFSGTPDPAAGTGGFTPGLGGSPWCIDVEIDVLNDALTLNAGSSAYAGAVPSGFGNW